MLDCHAPFPRAIPAKARSGFAPAIVANPLAEGRRAQAARYLACHFADRLDEDGQWHGRYGVGAHGEADGLPVPLVSSAKRRERTIRDIRCHHPSEMIQIASLRNEGAPSKLVVENSFINYFKKRLKFIKE